MTDTALRASRGRLTTGRLALIELAHSGCPALFPPVGWRQCGVGFTQLALPPRTAQHRRSRHLHADTTPPAGRPALTTGRAASVAAPGSRPPSEVLPQAAHIARRPAKVAASWSRAQRWSRDCFNNAAKRRVGEHAHRCGEAWCVQLSCILKLVTMTVITSPPRQAARSASIRRAPLTCTV